MTALTSALLALDKISKRFGAVVVAEAVDLALAKGEALGIIGPNGAGKTTLFGMVSGSSRRMPAACSDRGPDITRCRRRVAAPRD